MALFGLLVFSGWFGNGLYYLHYTIEFLDLQLADETATTYAGCCANALLYQVYTKNKFVNAVLMKYILAFQGAIILSCKSHKYTTASLSSFLGSPSASTRAYSSSLPLQTKDKYHDGLVVDGGCGSRVSSFTSVIALTDGFFVLSIVFHIADFFVYHQRNFFNSICPVVFSTNFQKEICYNFCAEKTYCAELEYVTYPTSLHCTTVSLPWRLL